VRFTSITLGALLFAACRRDAAPAQDPNVDPRTLGRLRFVVQTTGGAPADARLPLVVALHGVGDTPEAFAQLVIPTGLRVRLAAPAGPRVQGRGFGWFPLRSLLTDARWGESIAAAAAVVAPEIARLAQVYPTCGRPLVTGFAQGAMVAFALAARPDAVIGGAFPIAGELPPSLWPGARADAGALPVVEVFQGLEDRRVRADNARATWEAFHAAGYPGEFHGFAGLSHAVSTDENQALREALAATLRAQGCPAE
jgi:predicted esterase